MHIEIRIREVREKKNISINQLAEMTGITKSHLSYIERNEKEPSLSILIRIALALRVDEKELYKIYF
ncbi:MAG: helix-turn-helix transcriptional regulator [Clostridia bacterium]|nr:helix-turn-helix transcriptional regulator [Clostridia bacterium]